ncbi:hypothetical protein PPYR_08750 [Photinus pyralis]|uniref:Peptidase M13 N-terminal domain-containing protein n=2 Tax=Photinus pyralis TaxID=7054 RepID=A0A5N4AKA9_PHOPY|nr:hypothetical protein PPYR_08750 [Photinus pyralis]
MTFVNPIAAIFYRSYDYLVECGNGSLCKMRISMKNYLIVSVAMNITLVASVTTSNQMSNLCLTPGCIHAASSVLKNIDASVDPCDDFYQFACGNFLKQAVIPDDNDYASYFQITADLYEQQLRVLLEENVTAQEPRPFRLLKKIYQTCMNTTAIELDGLTTLKSILEELGGWPVVKGRRWNKRKFEWKRTVYKFRNFGYDTNYFIAIKIMEDVKNSSQHMLYIGPPVIFRSNASDNIKYLNAMVDVATDLGAKRRVAKRELNESLNFELKLSTIARPFQEHANFTLMYHRISVSELQQKVPNIPWLEYLNSVLNVPTITIKASDVIIAAPPIYFSELEKLLLNTPKRVQANYLMWKTVASSVPCLTEKLLHSLTQNMYSIVGWKKCVSLTLDSMPIATGALYVRKHFNEDAKKDAMEMVSDIRKVFLNIVKRADWMDVDTKKYALEKAEAMSSYIAYPDEFLSDETLEDFYKELHLASDNFLKIRLSTKRFDYESVAKRLVLPVNQTDWVKSGKLANVNAYYNVLSNRIILPAPILQGVFFGDDRPWYMNYGGIGFLISHEIVHGFDNKGRQFDKFGNLEDWWTPSTNEKFITKAQCIIDQYGNQSIPELGLSINGFRTQAENIADNGGIRNAYLAYNEWIRRNGREQLLPGVNYTDRQLFWISAANVWCTKMEPVFAKELIGIDTHSPAKFRINLPLSNTDYFARDFNCRIGSKMHPHTKCEVW